MVPQYDNRKGKCAVYGYDYYRYYQKPSPAAGVIILLLAIFSIATMWRIFTKAGEKGWKSLIPIYNGYVQWGIGWDTQYFWLVFGGAIGLSILNLLLGMMGRFGVILSGIIGLVWAVVCLVLVVKFSIRMAHRFGKSTAFGVVGLLIFSLIGYAILAWGSADYNAARDRGDGILVDDSQLAAQSDESKDYWSKVSGQ